MVSIAAAPARVWFRPRLGLWGLSTALFLVFLALSFGMIGIFSGLVWWWLMLFIAALVLFSAAALRSLGVSPYLVPAVCVVILALALTGLFGAGTGLLGIIPTPATFAHFATLFGRAGVAVNEQGVPAQPLTELFFVLALGTGLIALASDMLAAVLRIPALIGILMLLVLAVPVLLLDNGISPVWVVVCAIAYLYLLRVDIRMRRPGRRESLASVAITAASVVVALVVAVTAPGFTPGGVIPVRAPGISVGHGVNPLIDLGKDLRRPASVSVLDYTTTSDAQEYLKLTTLDQFSGATWTQTPGDTKPLSGDGEVGPPPGLSRAVATDTVSTSVRVGAMQSPWLPAPYPATKLRGELGTWTWDPENLTISSRSANASNQTYTVQSLDVQPSVEQLATAGNFVPESVRKDLVLPSGVPKIITNTAHKVTAQANTAYERAVALQNYFRNTDFTYSVTAPVDQGYDGDGLKVIATFLTKKAGYCVHFASAMAIMARTLGIPARVAVGYLPGTVAGSDDRNRLLYDVTSDDLHAWPELYFAGVGWVPFEPTVSRGVIPAYTQPLNSTSDSSLPSAPAPEVTSDAAVAPTTTPGAAASTQKFGDDPGSLVTSIAVVVAILVALLVPALLRRIRYWRRIRSVRGGRRPAETAWRELIDAVRDLRMPGLDNETPRVFAERLADAGIPENAQVALGRLVAAIERVSFDRPGKPALNDAPDLAADLTTVIDALAAESSLPRRVAAVWAPISLLPPLPAAGGDAPPHNA